MGDWMVMTLKKYFGVVNSTGWVRCVYLDCWKRVRQVVPKRW